MDPWPSLCKQNLGQDLSRSWSFQQLVSRVPNDKKDDKLSTRSAYEAIWVLLEVGMWTEGAWQKINNVDLIESTSAFISCNFSFIVFDAMKGW